MSEERHKYEYAVDLTANTAAAKVVRFVGNDKRVLEIGAGPGSITRLLKSHGNCRVTALELDLEAIEKLTPFCERIYRCDLNSVSWPELLAEEEKFQVVVAADVLEHLYDPWRTLAAMKDLLHQDGYVVISLPHVGHHAVVACLLDEDFDYQDYGLLDRTHIRFFGVKNIQKLFEDAGFTITAAEFVVKPPEETEFGGRWRRLPDMVKQGLMRNPFGMVYQVVVQAKPGVALPGGVDLFALPVPAPVSTLPSGASMLKRILYRLKRLALPYLSPRNRVRIIRVLDRLRIRL